MSVSFYSIIFIAYFPSRIRIPNLMAKLYYAELFPLARIQIQIPIRIYFSQWLLYPL